MKNLKKVLALALAFVMCFTMFAGAAVYSDVPAGSDYSEAVSLLSDLEIIAGKPDGSYGVNDTITRADAACLIARMMTGELVPSKYAGTSNFVDVPKDAYYESSVAYCALLGITSGVGNGKYEPLRTITDGEFVAMVTRALGYDTVENPLQFPMGNIQVAQAEGLLDGVNCVWNSPALRGEDAQIIYNALFADFDRAAKNQNVYQGADDHDDFTIAEEVFNLARLAVAKGDKNSEADFYDRDERDDMTCVSHNWVVAGKDTRDGENEYTAYSILDKNDELNTKSPITFSYDGDAESIMGYEVELWGDVDHTGDDFEVVAVKTVKGQTGVDWNPSMESDGTKMIVDDEKYQTNEAYMPIRNTEKDHDVNSVFTKEKGDAFSLVEKKNIEKKYLSVKDGNEYRLCDWDSDGDVDFIIPTIRDYAEVDQLSKSKITLKTLDGTKKTLDLDDDNLVIDAEGVEKGDVVEITEADRTWTKSDKEIVEIKLETIEAETKELTKVSTSKKLQPYFDGEKTNIADQSAWNILDWDDPSDYDYDQDDVGNDYDLHLNANGFIIKSAEADSDSKGYLIVLDTERGYDGLGSKYEPVSIKAMLDDGTVEVFDLDDTDIFYKNDKTERDVETSTGKTLSVAEDHVVGVVYKYYTDSDGVITKLVEATEYDARFGADAKGIYNDNTHVITLNKAVNGDANDTHKNLDLETAKVMFVIDGSSDKINKDGNTEDDWKLDEDDVAVISVDDLDDIEVSGLDEYSLVKKSDYNNHTYGSAFIAYKANDDYEAEAFVLAISNFDEIGHSKKVGLVTWASRDSSKIIEVTAAVDGKTEVFSTGSKADVDDIFDYKDMKDVEKAIGYGRYAEITFDGDGNVTGVEFFANNTTLGKYEARRLVVGNKVSSKYLSYLDEPVFFEDDENFRKVTTINWKSDLEYDDDALFYVMDAAPGIANVDEDDYAGRQMLVSNGFAEDSIYDRDDEELAIEVGSVEDITSSYIKGTANDTFKIVDVIVKDGDIVAAYIFKDEMDSSKNGTDYITTFTKPDISIKETAATDGTIAAKKQVSTLTVSGKVQEGNDTITVEIDGVEVTFSTQKDDTAATVAAKLADELNTTPAVVTGVTVANVANGVITLESTDAGADEAFELKDSQSAGGVTFAGKLVTEAADATVDPDSATPAKAVFTVKDGTYKLTADTQWNTWATGNAFVEDIGFSVALDAGVVYTANDVAELLAQAAVADNAQNGKHYVVSVKNNVVTVTNALVDNGEIIDFAVSID